MNCCIVRKIPYRLPGTSRLVWAVILAEREGLSLLLVRKPEKGKSHIIAIAEENVEKHFYEDANASRFHIEHEDLSEIGTRLQALGETFDEVEFERFFRWGESW